MTHVPRAVRLRMLAALALGILLASCHPESIIVPFRDVNGVWRGSEWGLEATDDGATLHHVCGSIAQVEHPLVWDRDRRVRGSAEWSWNERPDSADLVFDARGVRDGRIIITVVGTYGRTDTLLLAPRAAFWPDVVCD